MRFFNYLFFLMAPNFLALATTLENLGARWLLAKKVNFVPCAKKEGTDESTEKKNSLGFSH